MLTNANSDQSTATLASIPSSPSALDMLRSIYLHQGPYTSLYLQTWPLLHDPQLGIDQRWDDLRLDLDARGAPGPALDAIEARLTLPVPEDTAGTCVIAAADGHTIVDHSQEPPRRDFSVVDTLPYVAPLLEWDQHRVPHLVVTIDRTGADIVAFGCNHSSPAAINLIGSSEQLAADLTARADAIDARLVVIAGDPTRCQDLSTALTSRVTPKCRVVVDDHLSPDELAEATVRYVFDTAARTTVGYLREFRFLSAHDAAVDGTAATIEALTRGRPDVLLIHDDPTDQRRIWVGDDPARLSTMRRPGIETEARFVDAAIRSAVARDVAVHIIPSTGPDGPSGDVAAINRSLDAEPVDAE